MRSNWWGLGLGLMLTGTTAAQLPVTLGPPVTLGAPDDPDKPATLPLPAGKELPTLQNPVPTPPMEFGVGIPVSPPVRPPSPVYGPAFPEVRPPAPVSTAPIEEPPGPRFWAGMEYLLIRARGDVSAPVRGHRPARAAGRRRSRSSRPGDETRPAQRVRLWAGYWPSMPQLWGSRPAYWWLGQIPNRVSTAPSGTVLSRPFVDPRINGGEPRPVPDLDRQRGDDGSGPGPVHVRFRRPRAECPGEGNAVLRQRNALGHGASVLGVREDLSISAQSRAPTLDFES